VKRTFIIAALATIALVGAIVAGGSGTAKAGSGAAPAVNPANFVAEITNSWFPLRPGTTYFYRGVKDGKPSAVTFVVTHQKKVIQGVSTTVIHDTLRLNGKIAEKTIDWYAQDKRGNVWYFGEDTKELDANGKVISTEGSWQAGVNGARAGIYMPAHATIGPTWRQEYYKGHAEDRFTILAFHTQATVPFGSFRTAMMTKEMTRIEPNVIDHKLYVHGIGMVAELSVKGPLETGRLVQITTW
jgi:hypothetical protein